MSKRQFSIDDDRLRGLRYAAAGARAIAIQQADIINDLRHEIGFVRASLRHYRDDKAPVALTQKLEQLMADQAKAELERNRASAEFEGLQHQLEAVGQGTARVYSPKTER